MKFLGQLLADEVGASAAEYALILAIVGAALAVAAFALGSAVANSMNQAGGVIANCGGQC